jgi:hypothetical protein
MSIMRLPSRHQFLGRMEEVKKALCRDCGGALAVHRHLLHLALNEAEALAWLTPFPDLLFPVLAEEKATALKHWAGRQWAIQRASVSSALATPEESPRQAA